MKNDLKNRPYLNHELKKATKYYMNNYTSYKKTQLKFNLKRLDYLSIMIREYKFKHGLLKECPKCEKGEYKKSFCRLCLGTGLIDKKLFNMLK